MNDDFRLRLLGFVLWTRLATKRFPAVKRSRFLLCHFSLSFCVFFFCFLSPFCSWSFRFAVAPIEAVFLFVSWPPEAADQAASKGHSITRNVRADYQCIRV